MVGRFSRPVAVASLVFLSVAWCSSVSAAIKPVGQVILANGPFIAIQSDKSSRSLTRGSEFYQGDRLWTGPSTKAQVRFSDGAIMTLRPDTEFSVDEYEFDSKNADRNKSLFTLIKGGFRTLTGLISRLHPDGYKVKTAYAIVGVRGTTYETVIDSGLYAAAWQGTIYVENEKKLLELGFGQEFNYARVTSPNSAPAGMLEVPPQLQETIDPGLREAVVDPTLTRLTTGLLQDGVDTRLTAQEVASLDRSGFAVFGGTGRVGGAASDGAGGSPLFFDVARDVVFRQGSAPASGVQANVAGFPVSFGQWNASLANPAEVQPDSTNPLVKQSVTSPVYWITAIPATQIPGAGTGVYSAVSGLSQGAGEAGGITAFNINATVNFGTATVNGNMQVQNGPRVSGFFDQWNVNFAGNISGAAVNAGIASGTVNVDGATQLGSPTGSITGALTGPPTAVGGQVGPDGMAGAFDLRHGATNFVQGTFVARQ